MITAVLVVLASLLLIVGVFEKRTNAVCKSKKRLDGKTALVTGGTAGMGLEVATELARRGARVLIACPFPEEGHAAREHIVKTSGNQDVHFRPLQLASLANTRRFAADILQHEPRLDILVNNAGVGGPSDLISPDGINFIMQVNYFGKFLLTLLLLPLLKKSGSSGDPSRIVNTASVLHSSGGVDINNFHNPKLTSALNYLSRMKIARSVQSFLHTKHYCDSKFCVVLFTRELAKRLTSGENVVVNCVDPGFVGTNIFGTWNGWLGGLVTWFCYCIFKTPWQGAQTALYVALDETAGAASGEYFKNCSRSRAVFRAYDDKLAKAVWEESLRIVKLD